MDLFNKFYLDVLKNDYLNFDSKATREEYWMFFLINFLVSLVVGFVAGVLRLPLLSYVYSLALLLPNIAIAVRRIRDTGRSPLSILWIFFPFVGWIIIIVFLVQKSK